LSRGSKKSYWKLRSVAATEPSKRRMKTRAQSGFERSSCGNLKTIQGESKQLPIKQNIYLFMEEDLAYPLRMVLVFKGPKKGCDEGSRTTPSEPMELIGTPQNSRGNRGGSLSSCSAGLGICRPRALLGGSVWSHQIADDLWEREEPYAKAGDPLGKGSRHLL